MKIDEILSIPFVKTIVRNIFNKGEIEVIERDRSFILRLHHESEKKISRIILLPPYGYTSNHINETSPHPEVRKAKIEIKWGIVVGKKWFSLVKNAIKYQYYTTRNVSILRDELYPKTGDQDYKEEIKSSKQKFLVVKENGIGFYHSLVNLSGAWILLVLEKTLKLQKIPNIQSKISPLNTIEQKNITRLYEKILLYGDKIFKEEEVLIEKINKSDMNNILPVLIEMLNILETGKHEPCTVYAILLKIGRKDKKVIDHLKEGIRHKAAPKYYLEELIKKLKVYHENH
jgi:hypothetical protein